jgi:diaminopimelate decarboxylase
MATTQTLSHVYPIDGRLNAAGRLEIAGCDVLELAERFGTPAYVVSEDDLRARARAFIGAFEAAGQDDFRVVFASKAFGATAVMGVFAQEGLDCDVASGGELHLALRAGFSP